LPVGVNFRNEDVLAQAPPRPDDRSAGIDNGRRTERDAVRRAAGNIGSNDDHFVVAGPRDVDGPGESHHTRPFRRLLLLGKKMAQAPRATMSAANSASPRRYHGPVAVFSNGAPRNDSREFGAIQPAMRRAARNAPTVLRHRAPPGLIFSQPWQRIARTLHTSAHFLP
jgi:hypothetical protein